MPERKPPKPVSARPRDLAGFLKEQGHTLASSSEEQGRAPAPAGTASVDAPSDTPLADALPGLAVASPAEASPPLAAAPPQSGDTNSDAATQTFPSVSVHGEALGAVTMRGGKVHLASLVGLLELKMPAAEFARLKAARVADSFVDLDTLRGAGIAATLDPAGERINLSAL